MPWKRGDKWYTRFRFEGKQICQPTDCSTEAECRAYELDLKNKLHQDRSILDRKGPMLAEIADKYVNWLLNHPSRSQAHAVRSAGCLETVLKRLDKYGVKYCYRLTPDHVEMYKTERLKDKTLRGPNKTVTPRTVDLEVQSLKTMYNRGLKMGWLARNPIQHVELFRAAPNKILSFLRPDELRSLLNCARPVWRPICYFFITTGCRLQEGCLVEWRDVDFKRKCVRFRVTKYNREREVGLTGNMLRWLKEHKHKGKYVFETPHGNPRLNNFARNLALAGEKSGIKNRVHPHLLRHTFGTSLAYADLSPYEIQALLGHADIKTTMRYVHFARRYKDRDAVLLGRWLSEQVRGHRQYLLTPLDGSILRLPEPGSELNVLS